MYYTINIELFRQFFMESGFIIEITLLHNTISSLKFNTTIIFDFYIYWNDCRVFIKKTILGSELNTTWVREGDSCIKS